MSKALSVDLRRRVVEAVAAGAYCRAAAARFEVGVASAIRWVARARTRGDLSPDKRGGNVRSHRIDEHRDLILGWIVAIFGGLSDRIDRAETCSWTLVTLFVTVLAALTAMIMPPPSFYFGMLPAAEPHDRL